MGLEMPEISRATAATSPHSATCSISSTFSAERLDGQGDRCDWPAQRGTEEGGGYAEGGIIPVNIGRGIAQAIAQPIMEDWRQANQVVKNIRNQYPVTDSIAGIHPAISAAQVANDVMSGDVGGDTALNLAQSVPILKGISGAAKALNKQSGATINGVKYIVDMPNTVRKNTAITVGQTLGPPANAYSRGGIMPVVGAGTGTSDSVPVVVAGQDVRLSNGEGAAILPARTMRNPAAVQAVEGIIEATNGKPPVRGERGLAYGGILGQQNQTGISGVWRTGNSFTQTDSGPSIRTPSIAAMPYPAAQPVSAQPVPTQTTTTNIVRNGNSFSAAPPSLSSQALTSPAGQPAPRPRHWSARRPQSSRLCNSLLQRRPPDYRRLRQQSGADTAVSETTR